MNEALLKAIRTIVAHGAIEVSADEDKQYYREKLEAVHGVNLQVVPLHTSSAIPISFASTVSISKNSASSHLDDNSPHLALHVCANRVGL